MSFVSIVVPVYHNAPSLPDLLTRFQDVARRNPEDHFEFVFVDDGSKDNSFNVLQSLGDREPRVRIIKLSRNFGSNPALLAGLDQARGDVVVAIAADLQDPPELIHDMLALWRDGRKVVLAARQGRDDPGLTSVIADSFYALFRRFAIKTMPKRGFDFFLVDRQVCDLVKGIQENNVYLMGLILWLGFDPAVIYYHRQEREKRYGRSMWTFVKKLKYFVDAFVAFSYLPVRISSGIGLALSIFGLAYAFLLVILRLIINIPVEGWTSLMVVVLILSGVQMVMIGTLGEYMWRNLDETRRRPRFIIETSIDYTPLNKSLDSTSQNGSNNGHPSNENNTLPISPIDGASDSASRGKEDPSWEVTSLASNGNTPYSPSKAVIAATQAEQFGNGNRTLRRVILETPNRVIETIPSNKEVTTESNTELISALNKPEIEKTGTPTTSVRVFSRTAPWHRAWIYRGAVLGLAAALVGGIGEWLLFREAMQGFGYLLLFVAVVLVMVAWSGLQDHTKLPPRSATLGKLISWRAGLAIRLGGIFGALGLWAASMWAYFAHPDEIFGPQGVLWLIAMLLFAVSCLRWNPPRGSEADTQKYLGPKWTRLEIFVLASIVVISFIMRVTWLKEIPWDIDGDMFSNWREAQSFMQFPPTISAFTTNYLGLAQPSLWFIVPATFMKVFGNDLVGAKTAVAVLGALIVLPVYGIARLHWGRVAAAAAAIAIAASASMVHMSRLVMPDMATALWWAAAFYYLLKGLRSRRPADFMWAGLISGTSQYTHYASRMLPFVLAAFFAYLLVFHFKAIRERIGHLGLVVAGFLIGSGPINGYFVLHPEMWGSRANKGFLIPLSIPTNWDGWMQDWNIVTAQVRQNFLMFSVTPSHDFFYYASMLLPWEGVLLVLGVGCLLWRWKQPAAFLILLWSGSLLLLNSILEIPENPNPNLTHFRPAWAAFYLILALPPALWLNSLRRMGRRAWKVGAWLIGMGALFVVASNIYFYLVTYPPMQSVSKTIRTSQGRLYLDTKPTDIVRVVGGGFYIFDREYAHLLAPQTTAGEWFNQTRQLPLVGATSKNQIFVYALPDPYETIVRSYYPNGQVVPLLRSDGQEGVRSYHVSPEQLKANYGVKASFAEKSTPNNIIWQGQVPAVGAVPSDVVLQYPLIATWSGAVYIPAPNTVQLQMAGPNAANGQIWVPGQTSPNGPTIVDSGWLPFVAQADLLSPGQVDFLMGIPGASLSQVDPLHLWPQSSQTGLAVTIGKKGESLQHRIDPFIGSVLMWPIVNIPDIMQPGNLDPNEAAQIFNGPGLIGTQANATNSIRWEGDLYADGGHYGMNIYTGDDWQVRVKVDTQPVINQCGVPGGNHAGQVDMAQGWHHVQIDVMGGTSNGGVQWSWTRPDGLLEIVPPSRLRYTKGAGGVQFTWPEAPEAISCQP